MVRNFSAGLRPQIAASILFHGAVIVPKYVSRKARFLLNCLLFPHVFIKRHSQRTKSRTDIHFVMKRRKQWKGFKLINLKNFHIVRYQISRPLVYPLSRGNPEKSKGYVCSRKLISSLYPFCENTVRGKKNV